MHTYDVIEKLRKLADQLSVATDQSPELLGTLQFQYFSLPAVPVVYCLPGSEELQINLPIDSEDGRHLHLCLNTGFSFPVVEQIADDAKECQ
jgi:hypothetical protein